MTALRSTRGIFRSSAVIAVGTACSRLTGFVRLAVLAAVLGAGRLADAYTLANESPNMIYELLLGGVLTAVLVPTFVALDEDRDDRGRAAVFGTTLTALGVITVLAIVSAPVLSWLTTLRVPVDVRALERDVVTQLMRFLMIEIFFYGWFALLASALNARRRFVAAAFAPALNNVVVVALLLAVNHWFKASLDLRAASDDGAFLALLGLGTTAGIAVMTLALLPAARRAGIALRMHVAPRDPAVRRLVRLSGWTIGYVIANQIALWVVLILAAHQAGGALIYLGAYIFFMFPYGLLAVSVTTAIAPEMVTATRAGDHRALARIYSSGARLVVLTMALAGALFVALARPIVQIALTRGAFTEAAASTTAGTLVGFSVGLPAFALYLYTLRLFYARQDTRTPFALNVVQNALTIVLALVLAPSYGVQGLAWATSLAYIAAAVLTLVVAHRVVGGLGGRPLLLGVVRSLLAGGVAGVVAALVGGAAANAYVAVAAGGIAGVVAFGVTLLALRGDEFALARSLLRRPASRPNAPAPDVSP